MKRYKTNILKRQGKETRGEGRRGAGNDLLALANLIQASTKMSLAVTDQRLSSLGNHLQERARAAVFMEYSSLALKVGIFCAFKQATFDFTSASLQIQIASSATLLLMASQHSKALQRPSRPTFCSIHEGIKAKRK